MRKHQHPSSPEAQVPGVQTPHHRISKGIHPDTDYGQPLGEVLPSTSTHRCRRLHQLLDTQPGPVSLHLITGVAHRGGSEALGGDRDQGRLGGRKRELRRRGTKGIKHRERGRLKAKAKVRAMRAAPKRRGGDRELWRRGEVAQLNKLGVEELTVGTKVCPEASYFGAACQVGEDPWSGRSGLWNPLHPAADGNDLREPSATPLRSPRHGVALASVRGDLHWRPHVGGPRPREEDSQALERRRRRRLGKKPGEGRAGGGRAGSIEGQRRRPGPPGRLDREEKREKEKKKVKSRSRRKRSKKSKKEKAPKKKKKHRSRSPSRAGEKAKASKEEKAKKATSSSGSSSLNGKRPRGAVTKSQEALFSGTGLDPREKVRRRCVLQRDQ